MQIAYSGAADQISGRSGMTGPRSPRILTEGGSATEFCARAVCSASRSRRDGVRWKWLPGSVSLNAESW